MASKNYRNGHAGKIIPKFIPLAAHWAGHSPDMAANLVATAPPGKETHRNRSRDRHDLPVFPPAIFYFISGNACSGLDLRAVTIPIPGAFDRIPDLFSTENCPDCHTGVVGWPFIKGFVQRVRLLAGSDPIVEK